MTHSFVNVAVPPLEQLFTYAAPEPGAKVGTGLPVEFGRRHQFGYVVEVLPAPPDQIDKVKVLDLSGQTYQCFAERQLPFFKWVAGYYCESLARTLDTAVPPPVAPKYERYVEFVRHPERPLRGEKQRAVLAALENVGVPLDCATLAKRYPGAAQVLKKLEAQGLVRIGSKDSFTAAAIAAPAWAKREVTLNIEQQTALAAITADLSARRFSTTLLHGVTGSGKTEVYIEAILQARAMNCGALVIVPEIALTPQLIDRFAARLGGGIAVLHSAMAPRERWNAWRSLMDGSASIAIGARSGIFAPVQNLGLIVVDEEHDASYKQAEGLRYNARDLAVVLGRMHSCPVVLGSATPALETYYNARTGKYTYLALPVRHGAAPAAVVDIVDLNRCKPREMPSPNISPQLCQALSEVLARGEQAFVMYNRRGFAAYLQCTRCRAVLECPNCSVTLTLHSHDNSLKCHYCAYQSPVPLHCPHCKGDDNAGELTRRGAGTEKVFEELEGLFPEVKIARLDRDTVTQHDKYRAILDGVRAGDTQILVGTQMIAKGHDLPGVTLVGIVDCDVGLHIPDFRAAERSFQLLTQAAGRAGRGDSQGHVILQTRVPNHPSLLRTVARDYHGFAKTELLNRRQLNYPPFGRMLRIIASATEAQEPAEILAAFRRKLDERLGASPAPVYVLGPCPATLGKLRGRWRWNLLLKAKNAADLHTLIGELKKIKVNAQRVRVAFDLDPQDLL